MCQLSLKWQAQTEGQGSFWDTNMQIFHLFSILNYLYNVPLTNDFKDFFPCSYNKTILFDVGKKGTEKKEHAFHVAVI